MNLYEYHNIGGDNNGPDIYGTRTELQEFTVGTVGPNESFTLKKIVLYLGCAGADLTATVLVKLDGDWANPTLSSGTVVVSGAGVLWYDVVMSEATMVQGGKYGIFLRALTGTATNYIQWRIKNDDGYAGGAHKLYSDPDDPFGTVITYLSDTLFEVWGEPQLATLGITGTAHVMSF